jgi:hypothetical protein
MSMFRRRKRIRTPDTSTDSRFRHRHHPRRLRSILLTSARRPAEPAKKTASGKKLKPGTKFDIQNRKYKKQENMKRISFSRNWNKKLNCSAFSTIRLHSDLKYRTGARYIIEHAGKIYGIARIIDRRSILISQINNAVAYMDTGYGIERTKEIIRTIYSDKNINWETQLLDYIILAYVETNIQEIY